MKIKHLLTIGLCLIFVENGFTQAPTITSTRNVTRNSTVDAAEVKSGEIIKITGTGFTNVIAVRFGDMDAASYTIDNDNQITATTGAGKAGNISVITLTDEVKYLTKALSWRPATDNSTLVEGDLVINKIFNSTDIASGDVTGNPTGDAIELLITKDHTDLRNAYIKDFGLLKSGGVAVYYFKNIPLWADLRAGTVIVITNGSTTSPDKDVDLFASIPDFNLSVSLNDFNVIEKNTASPVSTFDIQGDDFVSIQKSISQANGMIAALGSGPTTTSGSGNDFHRNSQKIYTRLNDLDVLQSGMFQYITSLTGSIQDYKHSGATFDAYAHDGSKVINNVLLNDDVIPVPLVLGQPNNAQNAAYVAALRQAVLPVKLISFTGKRSGQSVQLSWATASEKNSSYFELLRSDDGTNFAQIKSVTAAGNSNFQQNYAVLDAYPLSGKNYYKLVQYDNDGKNEELGICMVNTDNNQLSLNVYLSQEGELLNYDIFSPSASDAKLVVLDISGRQLFMSDIKLNKGLNKSKVSSASFPQGINLVVLSVPNASVREKIIK